MIISLAWPDPFARRLSIEDYKLQSISAKVERQKGSGHARLHDNVWS